MNSPSHTKITRQTWGKLAALTLFVTIILLPTPADLAPAGQRLLAVTGAMGVLWFTQSIPIAVTSLIPLAAYPWLGIQTSETVSSAYINSNVFLFIGGFLIALGIEKWGLHRRIALAMVSIVGNGPRQIVLGFMLASGFLSMWLSNTASTLLMLPIGIALLKTISDLQLDPGESVDTKMVKREFTENPALRFFGESLFIGIAYAASIGGFTTLVGTPTNIAFQQIWRGQFPDGPALSSAEWMMLFVPLGLALLLCAWGLLVWNMPSLPHIDKFDRRYFRNRLKSLGTPSRAEWWMLFIFVTTAAMWIFRKPLVLGSEPILPGWGNVVTHYLLAWGVDESIASKAVDDATVVMTTSLLMFFIPMQRDGKGKMQYLFDWKTAEKLPWDVILLIGGGFAVANAFRDTQLSEWVGMLFAQGLSGWPVWVVVMLVTAALIFLTEFTTNVATVNATLPVLAGVAMTAGWDPRLIMIPAAIASSCAFMLPTGTPPNAIVFGSGFVRMERMLKVGVLLNVIAVVLISVTTMYWMIPRLGINPTQPPEWATVVKDEG
ncbi:MAG: SLC13 family permease [Planctomycetota bacterium]|nr:SLC13 family permease [Planctomycetota bacterium]